MAKFNIGKVLEGLSKSLPLAIAGGGTLIGGYMAITNSVYTVDAGHMSIKYNRISGIGSEVFREGVHFRIPWFERQIIFDVKARPYMMTSLTGSRDLQMVNISLRALHKPHNGHLPEIYRYLGPDYEQKVLPSIVNEVLKSVVAQYNASQLIKDRELVSRMIRQRLVQRAQEFYILLDDVAITELSFSAEYNHAVESKQVAQQQAEQARYLVLKAQEEKKKTIIAAEGEKESAKMIGEAIKQNPGFLELRRIAVAKDVASILSKSNNRMVLSSEGLLLNLMGSGGKSSENLENSIEASRRAG